MPVLRSIWPEASILGIDASAEMLAQAQESTAEDKNISYLQTDIRQLQLDEPADVIVSNAALHWLPDHRELLPRLQENLAPGGVLAIQVPGNFSAPSHRLLYELAAKEPYAPHIGEGVLITPTSEVADYMLDLAAPGWQVEGWETKYQHLLTGTDPVFSWISSTSARPVLHALEEPLRSQFITEYKAALREAYPVTALGTIFPMRRLFFTARKPGA